MEATEYISQGMRSVEGWLTPTAASCISSLAREQQHLGIKGGACEIGVHHGRLFILLALLVGPHEKSAAIDLFDLQNENIDGSGRGNRDAFLANLRRFGITAEVVTENSLRMTAERVRSLVGPVRLFSIDGGHAAEITYNDLAIASASICDGGLVFLDDFFSLAWPGVTEGAFRFVHERGALEPVAFLSNKMIFASRNASAYRKLLSGNVTEIFGAPCVIDSTLGLRQRLVATPLWRAIRDTRIGGMVRRVAR